MLVTTLKDQKRASFSNRRTPGQKFVGAVGHINFFLMTRQAMYVKRDTGARTCKHSYSGNAIRIAYSKCELVGLGIRLQCPSVILSSVVCHFLQDYFILSHKQQDLKKKVWNMKCVFWFCLQILSETFYDEMSEIWSKMYIGLQVK